ncbi:MAG: hypothetical protein LBT08_08945 [Synergistaceae bacterium]|jgi:hypothetical protein|nr:hypothetical protein [Synergistaceae bacterium]
MIGSPRLKPELEIPEKVWSAFGERDFVNFPVPLLNPPVESEDGLFWSGQKLMKLSRDVAAFEHDEDASLLMPYGHMFEVLPNEDETLFAQIYAIFFERAEDEWRMVYRVMNCDRILKECDREFASLPDAGEEPLSSNWMLSLTGVENWMTLDAYLNYYCGYESYDKYHVAVNLSEQLYYMGGEDCRVEDVRIMAMPGGVIVLISKLAKGWALMVDIVKNNRLARFVMDDPSHLVESFWRLHSKMLLSASDRMEMDGMLCDARHFSLAIKSAREQKLIEEEVTAAAFYC